MFTAKGAVTPAQPNKPIAEQIPADTDSLLATFGVNVLVDEAGDRVLVGYGQAEPSSSLATAGTIAQQKVRLTPLFGQQNRTFKVDAVAVTTGKS
jgi:hypothetical protein